MNNDAENEIARGILLADNDLGYYREAIAKTVKRLNALDPQNWPDEILSSLRHTDPVEMADSLSQVITTDRDQIKEFQGYPPAEKLSRLADILSEHLYLFVLQERTGTIFNILALANARLATLFFLAQDNQQLLPGYVSGLTGRTISDIEGVKEALPTPEVEGAIEKGWQNKSVLKRVLGFCHTMNGAAFKFAMEGDTLIKLADAAIIAAYRAAEPETYKEMFGLTDEQVPKGGRV